MKKISLLKSLFVVLALSLFSVSAFAEDGVWTLVSDASKLAIGDKIVIAATDYDYAISTTQNSNNRGQAAITKTNSTITIGETVQILTLEAGAVDNTFAFNTGSGYLYAASSSKNYLKTQVTNNANGSWSIAIDAKGVATVVAKGSNTRATMQYNQQSSLFACYSSASQKAISIYKLEDGTAEEVVVTAITLDQTTLALEQYREAQLIATLTPADATTLVEWTTSDATIATVKNGFVTAKAVGTATITAKAGELTATCAVTVAEATVLTCAKAAEYAASVSGNNVNYVGGQYVVRGYVTEIATAYDEKYKNISVWMADTKDGGEVFELYRGKSTNETICKVGDYIEVVGYLTKYNTTPETAQGATYTVIAEPAPAITATWNIVEGTVVEDFTSATLTFTGVESAQAKSLYSNYFFYKVAEDGTATLVPSACSDGYMDATAIGTAVTFSIDKESCYLDMPQYGALFALTTGNYRIVVPAGAIKFNGDANNLNTEEYVLNFGYVAPEPAVEVDAAYTVNPENNATLTEIRELVITFTEYETITVAELDLVSGSNIPMVYMVNDLNGVNMPAGYIFFKADTLSSNALRLYVEPNFNGGMDSYTMEGVYSIIIPAGVVTFGEAGISKEIVLNYTVAEPKLPMEVEFENIAAIYKMGMWDMKYYESYDQNSVKAILNSQPTVVDKVVAVGAAGLFNNYYLNDGTGVIVLQTPADDPNAWPEPIEGLNIEVGKKLPAGLLAGIDFKTIVDEETYLPNGNVYGAPVMIYVPRETGDTIVDEEGFETIVTESNTDFVARCVDSDFVEDTVTVTVDELLANRMQYAGKLLVVDTIANYYAEVSTDNISGVTSTKAYMYWDANEAFDVESFEEEGITYVFVYPKYTEDYNNYVGKLFSVQAENLPKAALNANATINVAVARFDWNSIAIGQTFLAKEFEVKNAGEGPGVDVENSKLAVNIYSNNGAVCVETEAGAMIEVYTVDGLRLFAGVSNTNTTIINGLNTNVAIISVNGEAYKVCVK